MGPSLTPTVPQTPKPAVEKSPFEILANRLEVDEMSMEHILSYIEWLWSDALNNRTVFTKAPIEWTQIEHIIIYAVAERLDHYCGDNLVNDCYPFMVMHVWTKLLNAFTKDDCIGWCHVNRCLLTLHTWQLHVFVFIRELRKLSIKILYLYCGFLQVSQLRVHCAVVSSFNFYQVICMNIIPVIIEWFASMLLIVFFTYFAALLWFVQIFLWC